MFTTLKSDLVVSGKKHSWEYCLSSVMDLSVSGLMIEAVRIWRILEEEVKICLVK